MLLRCSIVLELAILGLLMEHPMHGYDLRKHLRGEFGLLSSLSFGSLYPALARLEASGAVREVAPGLEGSLSDQAGPNGSGSSRVASPAAVGLTGSLSGELAAFKARLAARSAAYPLPNELRQARRSSTRSRKVYEITPVGENLFETLLSSDGGPTEDGRSFAVRWAFARHLPCEARLRLLERRKRELEARLGEGERRRLNRTRPLDRFESSIIEHSDAQVRFDLDWIGELIGTEQSLLGRKTETEVS